MHIHTCNYAGGAASCSLTSFWGCCLLLHCVATVQESKKAPAWRHIAGHRESCVLAGLPLDGSPTERALLLSTALQCTCTCMHLLEHYAYCRTWGELCAARLALGVAAEPAWPERVRRTALLLSAVLCRGSTDAARHFMDLQVSS